VRRFDVNYYREPASVVAAARKKPLGALRDFKERVFRIQTAYLRFIREQNRFYSRLRLMRDPYGVSGYMGTLVFVDFMISFRPPKRSTALCKRDNQRDVSESPRREKQNENVT